MDTECQLYKDAVRRVTGQGEGNSVAIELEEALWP